MKKIISSILLIISFSFAAHRDGTDGLVLFSYIEKTDKNAALLDEAMIKFEEVINDIAKKNSAKTGIREDIYKEFLHGMLNYYTILSLLAIIEIQEDEGTDSFVKVLVSKDFLHKEALKTLTYIYSRLEFFVDKKNIISTNDEQVIYQEIIKPVIKFLNLNTRFIFSPNLKLID